MFKGLILRRSIYSRRRPLKDDHIIVAMSSGVDSSVAAALLAREHKNVTGVFMANWSMDAKCVESDWNDVQRVCDHIGIPSSRVNFEKEYWSDVFEPMLEMYRRGLTPNPDVGCNRYVKFGSMIEHLSKTFSKQNWWLATGHYSRILKSESSGEHHLLRAKYMPKDQSFYLSMMKRDIIPRVLLPLGEYTKPEVREMAVEMQLPTSHKPDSQGLCFVSQSGNFRSFLDEYLPACPGNIVTPDGKVWGKHKGLWHATIGQRSGISMPQGDPKYKGVWFVSEKRPEANEIVIVKGSDHEALLRNCIKAKDWVWLTDTLPCVSELSIQFRSLQEPIPLKSADFDMGVLVLSQSCKGMAPGQNVVVYHGEQVMGAGFIMSTECV